MSKQANAPKNGSSQPDLGKGTINKLSELEQALLQEQAVKQTPQADGAQPAELTSQALESLATFEGDLLQEAALGAPAAAGEDEPVDEAALWDSLAELEVDFLYDEVDEPVAEAAEVMPEPTPAASDLAEAEEAAADDLSEALAALEVDALHTDEVALPLADDLQDLEQEILAEEVVETAVSPTELLATETELLQTDDSTDDQPLLPAAELAPEPATEPEPMAAGAPEELSDWQELADMEADLLADVALEADVVAPLAELTAVEDELLAAETPDVVAEQMVEEEVVETAVSTTTSKEPDDYLIDFDDEESDYLDNLITTIDTDVANNATTETMLDLAPDQDSEAHIWEQHVIFTLSGVKYAVPAANIREVGDINYITPVPNVPDWLLGITNLRGDILSLVHLGSFLGLRQNGSDQHINAAETEMMVVQSEQDTMAITTGIIVDEVSDIRELAVDKIRVPTAPIDNQLGTYMRGVYEENNQMYILLDLQRLLMSPDMWQFEAL